MINFDSIQNDRVQFLADNHTSQQLAQRLHAKEMEVIRLRGIIEIENERAEHYRDKWQANEKKLRDMKANAEALNDYCPHCNYQIDDCREFGCGGQDSTIVYRNDITQYDCDPIKGQCCHKCCDD